MKSSVRTELMAIPIALAILGLLFLVMLAAVEGVWGWVLLGLGVLALLTAVAVVLGRRRRHPSALDTPSQATGAVHAPGDVPDATYRVVVVCDESTAVQVLGHLDD